MDIKKCFLFQVCSYVTESLSVVFLIVTVAVLCVYKNKISSDRTFVQINLALSLLFLHVCILVGEVAVTSQKICEVVTVATHFFFIGTGEKFIIYHFFALCFPSLLNARSIVMQIMIDTKFNTYLLLRDQAFLG